MILHTINKSPFASPAVSSCLRFAAPDDAIVLLEDGVYAAAGQTGSPLHDCGLAIFAIRADVNARGLASRLDTGIKVIDYPEFVNLCTRYDIVKNWS